MNRVHFAVMQNKSPVVYAGAIASVPVPSLYPVGAVAVDGALVYENKRVGNFDNVGVTANKDTVRTTHSTFDANSDFEFDIVFKQDALDAVGFTGIFCQSLDGSVSNRGFWIERFSTTSAYIISFYSGGVNAGHTLSTPAIIDGLWHDIKVKQVSKIVSVYVDGALRGTINNVGWVVNPPQAINIGSQPSGGRCIKGNIAKVSLQTAVGGFCYDFSEGAGTTLFDSCGTGNNATLTDSSPNTFWEQAWVLKRRR